MRDLRGVDQTHGTTERAPRRVREGTSSVLVQSGLQERWFAEVMKRNVQDQLADGQTLYEHRFKSPFDGPIIPVGAEVKFNPIQPKVWNIQGIRLERGRKLDW